MSCHGANPGKATPDELRTAAQEARVRASVLAQKQAAAAQRSAAMTQVQAPASIGAVASTHGFTYPISGTMPDGTTLGVQPGVFTYLLPPSHVPVTLNIVSPSADGSVAEVTDTSVSLVADEYALTVRADAGAAFSAVADTWAQPGVVTYMLATTGVATQVTLTLERETTGGPVVATNFTRDGWAFVGDPAGVLMEAPPPPAGFGYDVDPAKPYGPTWKMTRPRGWAKSWYKVSTAESGRAFIEARLREVAVGLPAEHRGVFVSIMLRIAKIESGWRLYIPQSKFEIRPLRGVPIRELRNVGGPDRFADEGPFPRGSGSRIVDAPYRTDSEKQPLFTAIGVYQYLISTWRSMADTYGPIYGPLEPEERMWAAAARPQFQVYFMAHEIMVSVFLPSIAAGIPPSYLAILAYLNVVQPAVRQRAQAVLTVAVATARANGITDERGLMLACRAAMATPAYMTNLQADMDKRRHTNNVIARTLIMPGALGHTEPDVFTADSALLPPPLPILTTPTSAR